MGKGHGHLVKQRHQAGRINVMENMYEGPYMLAPNLSEMVDKIGPMLLGSIV